MSSILVQSRAFSQKMKTIFVPSALAIFLAACAGRPDISENLRQEAYANSEFYINQIDKTSILEEQQTYRLLAIRKLIEENKSVEAQNTFYELNVAKLNENANQKLEYELLTAQLYALQGNAEQAHFALKRLPLAQLSATQSLRVYQTQARIAENRQDILEFVRARAMTERYLKDSRSRQENNDKIWETLRNANRGMLENAQAGAGELELAGWLALINSYNANISNPSALPQVIENWKLQYPSHSATRLTPSELQNVANFQQTQLNGVALMLPLSGDTQVLGEIIKRGFDDAKGADSIPVKVYDTNSADIESLLNQAQIDGVQTVIGPLLKERVDALLRNPQIGNMNVLALNSTSNARAIPRVCYYGLSPEAEARAAAERLFNDGITNAIVATPQTDVGQRSSAAFSERWRELTLRDADIRYYNQPLDSVVSLQNGGVATGSALYVVGNADELFEIKQGLNNQALEVALPVYASSRSHSPNSGDEFRLTMEGVKFSEIPLFTEAYSAEFQKANSLSEGDYSMMRLYAMGSDAWSVANKFNEFRQIPGFKVSGLTGTLQAGRNCNIERHLSWLEYRNGTVVSLN